MLDKIEKTVIRHSVPNRPSLPIINNVLIGKPTPNGKAFSTIHTNNLDYTVDVCGFGVRDCETTLVPKKTAIDCLGIAWENSGDTVRFDDRGLEIPSTDKNDFPDVPDLGHEYGYIDFDWSSFQQKASFALKSVSKDLTRLSLCGVLLDIDKDGKVWMVSTDGRRLHKIAVPSAMYFPNDRTLPVERQVIIPGDVMGLLCKLKTGKKRTTCTFYVYDEYVKIALNIDGIASVYINARQCEGPYPNYSQVIPTVNCEYTEIEVSANDLRDAMKQCKETLDVHNLVRFETKDVGLAYSAVSPDKGKTAGKLDASYSGQAENIAWGLNGLYVLDSIPKDADSVSFFVKQSPSVKTGKPCVDSALVLRFDGMPDYLVLVMPLRLAD
jgi:DNA polymerase III sliding clamp (beta) subunit (PCNA family)